MITKNDCMQTLVKLEELGTNVDKPLRELLMAKDIPMSVLKFINTTVGIDAANFYEYLRISYNNKKSKLYGNIVSCDSMNFDAELPIICSALLTQIMLFGKKLDRAKLGQFFAETRVPELLGALNSYSINQQINKAALLQVLKAIRSDLLVLEHIAGRREVAL